MMKRTTKSLEEMLGPIPEPMMKETELSFAIADRIYKLMTERGLSKRQFAVVSVRGDGGHFGSFYNLAGDGMKDVGERLGQFIRKNSK